MIDCQNVILSEKDLSSIIPHAYPFRLVDKVKIHGEIHGDVSCNRYTGFKYIGSNEPFFQGHFPGEPIMPGVLQIEAMAQTVCAGLIYADADPHYKVRLASMDKVKFKAEVNPGCLLRLEVKLESKMGKVFACSGEAYVDDVLVAEAEFKAVLIRIEKTLAIIKPGAVARGLVEEIIEVLRVNNIGISYMRVDDKNIPLRKRMNIAPFVKEFYGEHAERPFFNDLCSIMSQGDSVVMTLHADNVIAKYRDLMGATDPAKALPGTLRNLFGLSIDDNAVHGSDSASSAQREIKLFFPEYANIVYNS
jgi:nucleoside-diphosphate kinase